MPENLCLLPRLFCRMTYLPRNGVGGRCDGGGGGVARSNGNNVQLPLHLQLNAAELGQQSTFCLCHRFYRFHRFSIALLRFVFVRIVCFPSPAFFLSDPESTLAWLFIAVDCRDQLRAIYYEMRVNYMNERRVSSPTLAFALPLSLSHSLKRRTILLIFKRTLDYGAEEQRPYERSVQAPDDLLHFAFALNCECDF